RLFFAFWWIDDSFWYRSFFLVCCGYMFSFRATNLGVCWVSELLFNERTGTFLEAKLSPAFFDIVMWMMVIFFLFINACLIGILLEACFFRKTDNAYI